MTIITDFVKSVQEKYKTGAATEHSYRPALEKLFNSLAEDIHAINEPKRIECGAPDFIIQRKLNRGEVAVGYVEAKDICIAIRGMKDTNKLQQERYKKALPNLIYTNCLDWDFYRNGELIASVTIADYLMGIQPSPSRWRLALGAVPASPPGSPGPTRATTRPALRSRVRCSPASTG